MTVDRSTFVARLFQLCHLLAWQFKGPPEWAEYEAPERTDLCTFMRTILVSAPLALAMNMAIIGWAFFVLSYLLFMLWLNLPVVGFVLFCVIAVAALLAGGTGLYFAVKWLTRRSFSFPATRETAKVIAAYYRAKKSRICPLIDLKGAADEVA